MIEQPLNSPKKHINAAKDAYDAYKNYASFKKTTAETPISENFLQKINSFLQNTKVNFTEENWILWKRDYYTSRPIKNKDDMWLSPCFIFIRGIENLRIKGENKKTRTLDSFSIRFTNKNGTGQQVSFNWNFLDKNKNIQITIDNISSLTLYSDPERWTRKEIKPQTPKYNEEVKKRLPYFEKIISKINPDSTQNIVENK